MHVCAVAYVGGNIQRSEGTAAFLYGNLVVVAVCLNTNTLIQNTRTYRHSVLVIGKCNL